MHAAQNTNDPVQDYLSAHGYTYWATIQPAGRFWHFQLVEAASTSPWRWPPRPRRC